MNDLILDKIKAVLFNAFAQLPIEEQQRMTGHPTVATINGAVVEFSSNGTVYCIVERAWLADDDDPTIPPAEFIATDLPDTVPADWTD